MRETAAVTTVFPPLGPAERAAGFYSPLQAY